MAAEAGGQPRTWTVEPAGEAALFPLGDVQLTESPFKHAQDLLREYLLAHDVERFLAPFRAEAGLPEKAPSYPNWESSGLDGHSAGHYLTALAQLVATSGDEELQQRLDAMVAGLAEIQAANGDGYVGGVPGGRQMWRDIAGGQLKAESFGLNGGWVPWYNLHKTFAGLRDAWRLTRHEQAREVFLRLCDWCDRFASTLTDEQLQNMLRTEHGGMNEVLADAYAISGDEKYLALARRFTHRAILDPLLGRRDELTGLHANTQIPKITGVERISQLGGDEAWHGAAAFFWDTVVGHRSVAIGGNSVREHFHPLDDFSGMIESREGPETCNTYNMLRLTEQLFARSPQARYADYYERALYNHILSSQHPGHGGFVYFTPMRPRDYRVYSKPGECFWCCVGTGMENHGKYGQFIYAHAGDDLFVNLFIPSTLTWRQHGLSLRQETRFPDEPATTLTLGLKEPRRFSLRVRHPGWVRAGGLAVRINGKEEAGNSTPGSYVALERTWRDGDRIELALPMDTRVEPLPDHSGHVALAHGPVVLGARTGEEALDGLIAGDGRMAHIGPGALLPLDQAPMLVAEPDALVAGVKPVAGSPLTFTAEALIRPEGFRGLRLEPFFRIHDSRYIVYWRTATPEHYPELVREIEGRERERLALEARTIDVVQAGQQQPEVEHRYAGENSTTGVNLGRSWRAARDWFSYEMRNEPGTPMELRITVWEAQWGKRRFDIVVNDHVLAQVTLGDSSAPRFAERSYPVPADVAGSADTMRVKFVARDGTEAGAIYEVRLVRAEQSGAGG